MDAAKYAHTAKPAVLDKGQRAFSFLFPLESQTLRARPGRSRPIHRDGVYRGRDAARQDAGRARPALEAGRVPLSGGRRASEGALARHHSPRPKAGEHHGHGRRLAKVLDFGLATSVGEEVSRAWTVVFRPYQNK